MLEFQEFKNPRDKHQIQASALDLSYFTWKNNANLLT